MDFLVRVADDNPRVAPDAKVIPAEAYAEHLELRAALEHAQRRADQILADAQQAYEDERRRGFEEGLEEGKLEAAERLMEAVARTVDYFGTIETRMVDLVLAATRKVLADFDARDLVVQVVKGALLAMRNQKQVTLRLPPQQIEGVRARLNEILAAYPAIGFIDLSPDPRLQAGGCILESEIGTVDASIEVQLEAIGRALKKTLGDVPR